MAGLARPGFRRAQSPVAPTESLEAAKAPSQCSSKVAAAAPVTERFWKAGFSGSILLLEEGRADTSASLNRINERKSEGLRAISSRIKNPTSFTARRAFKGSSAAP